MTENRTTAFLGPVARRAECRVAVVSLAAFSGGWGVFVTGAGERVVLKASLPAPGGPAGLWAREHRVPIAAGKARALLARCAELDLCGADLTGTRPLRPDEPTVAFTLWNADGAELSVHKPLGVPVPALDAIARAAQRLVGDAARTPPTHEGPLGSRWTPWQ